MIDIIKPRRRHPVSFTLLPEERDALETWAKKAGVTKSRAVSHAIRKLPGFEDSLQRHKEAYDKRERTKTAKQAKVIQDIRQDISQEV